MGNASSSSVKNIQIDQDKNNGTGGEKAQDVRPNSGKQTQRSEAQTCELQKDSSEIEKLTQQLCESESQRLDLEDRVQSLEEELERIHAQTIEASEKPCDETLRAKDQYIAKLEKEKKDVENEFQKMKVRHRKKVKQLNTEMAEYKQEVNFQMMELKDEIKKLQLEVKDKSGSSSASVLPELEDKPKLPGGEKMKLILELSEQVTEQQDKITALEQKLKDKDQLVQDFRLKLKNNSEYLKVTNRKCDSGDNGSENISSIRSSQSHSNPSLEKYSLRKLGQSKKTQRLEVKEYVEDDEGNSLSKLSSFLHGVRADKSETGISDDSLDEILEDADNRSRNLHGSSDVMENDVATGRDSGLGSAGKREEEQRKEKSKNVLDWHDSASGLSDSDFERDSSFSSKIASAPPVLQAGGNRRQKKKSNSLRKKVSNHDRPPRPGMAFMNSVVEEPAISEYRSKVISPVHVS